MNGDKKYPKFLINEDFLVYGSVFISVLFVLIVIFFNNIPITDFEVFIDTYLIKGNGVYSHIYSFQSEVISNLSMIIAPLFAIYTVLTSKLTYLSEREMIDSGITIEKSIIKTIQRKLVFIISLLLLVATFIFLTYIDSWDLQGVETNTLFITDNVVCLLFLNCVFCIGTLFALTFLFSVVLHPITFLRYHYQSPFN